MQVRAASCVLTLADRNLLVDGPRQFVDQVVSEMVPACRQGDVDEDTDWRVTIRPGPVHHPPIDASPELALRPGGPAVTITENVHDRLVVVGMYRPGSAPVRIETRFEDQATVVMPSSLDHDQVHWVSWLVKVFFASRLLAGGWRMVHASAVAVRGRALMVLAGPRGGKSVLAHLACRDLGASFLSDDLVLLGPDGTVVGWPTRVCLPSDLAPVGVGRPEGGSERPRVIFGLSEHRALGIPHNGPRPLGAVIYVRHEGDYPVGRVCGSVARRRSAWAQAERIPVQRMYTSDLLGLTGGPAVTGRPAPLASALSGGVEVELATPDPIGPQAVAAIATHLPRVWAARP